MYTLNSDYNQHVRKCKEAKQKNEAQPSLGFLNMIRYPLVWNITMWGGVVSFISDPLVGLFEAAVILYRREADLREHLQVTLVTKLIASPVQHLAFLVGNLALPGLVGLAIAFRAASTYFSQLTRTGLGTKTAARIAIQRYTTYVLMGIFCVGSVGSLALYQEGQRAVGKLPDWARPKGFTIFINGGACDSEGKKFINYE